MLLDQITSTLLRIRVLTNNAKSLHLVNYYKNYSAFISALPIGSISKVQKSWQDLRKWLPGIISSAFKNYHLK